MENTAPPALKFECSEGFSHWLAAHEISIALTTYQANKLLFVGPGRDQRLAIFERSIERPMALLARDDALYISTLYQIWFFKTSSGRAPLMDTTAYTRRANHGLQAI